MFKQCCGNRRTFISITNITSIYTHTDILEVLGEAMGSFIPWKVLTMMCHSLYASFILLI